MFPGPAQTKFWETPELIAELLTFLDLPSTLRLAKCHQLTQDVIQGSWVWNKLIRRFCPHDQEDEDQDGYLAHENLETVGHLVAILKLMRSPNTLLLDLLDLICERFEAKRVSIRESVVYMKCPCDPEYGCHVVTSSGFLLLEMIERAFDTAEQAVLGCNIRQLWEADLLALLASRLSRQQEDLPDTVLLERVKIGNKRSTLAFHSLSQLCPTLSVSELEVCGKIEREGWGTIAESVKKVRRGFLSLEAPKELLMEAPKTDLRVLWEGVSHWIVTLEGFGQDDEAEELGDTYEMFSRDHGEAAFDRLQLLLEMDEAEWAAFRREEEDMEAWDSGEEDEEEEKEGFEEEEETESDEVLRRTRRTTRKMMMCWKMILLQSTTSKIK